MTQGGGYPETSQATTAFILGLVGFAFPFLAPFAWYIGSQELKAMDEGRRDPKDRGLAQAGRVLGMVITFLMIGFVVIGILVVLLLVAMSRTTSIILWIG